MATREVRAHHVNVGDVVRLKNGRLEPADFTVTAVDITTEGVSDITYVSLTLDSGNVIGRHWEEVMTLVIPD